MELTRTHDELSLPAWLEAIGWLGRCVTACVGYVGGVSILLGAAAGSIFQTSENDRPAFWPLLKAELWWFLLMGFPLVGLVHVGMGSFLSLQAYFGSTFVDGTGAVVGVGLLRNLASLMAGLTLCGLYAGRIVPEMVESVRQPGTGMTIDCGAHALPRIAAAAVATTLLSIWGTTVGTLVGWQCADTMMGLSYETFFMMFYQMIWFRDILGILCKGALFGAFPAAICCYEGLRLADHFRESAPSAAAVTSLSAADRYGGPIVRAASLSMVAILVVNMTWFLLVYHAVPVYGPSLLNPPTP